MTPTAQASYVSAPTETFNARRIATQPFPDHVNDLHATHPHDVKHELQEDYIHEGHTKRTG